jgi:hypothetical protein
MSPTYLFNAPPHHSIIFGEDNVVYGGQTVDLAEGVDPATVDARLQPVEDAPATEAEATTEAQAAEAEAADTSETAEPAEEKPE